jgi:hypothetical protein
VQLDAAAFDGALADAEDAALLYLAHLRDVFGADLFSRGNDSLLNVD